MTEETTGRSVDIPQEHGDVQGDSGSVGDTVDGAGSPDEKSAEQPESAPSGAPTTETAEEKRRKRMQRK